MGTKYEETRLEASNCLGDHDVDEHFRRYTIIKMRTGNHSDDITTCKDGVYFLQKGKIR